MSWPGRLGRMWAGEEGGAGGARLRDQAEDRRRVEESTVLPRNGRRADGFLGTSERISACTRKDIHARLGNLDTIL